MVVEEMGMSSSGSEAGSSEGESRSLEEGEGESGQLGPDQVEEVEILRVERDGDDDEWVEDAGAVQGDGDATTMEGTSLPIDAKT